ncbi:MAG: thioredoxin domain-containing protein [Gemmatimonadetes bacterium]|nr:thioredoxin domain-containing protein [Gemmatimonadota bacterium]
MKLQRDGDRIVLAVQTRHLKAAGVGLAVLAVAAAVALGRRALGASREVASADSLAWAAAPRFDVAVTDRPFTGSTGAPVTIVEFTDYLCPFCRRFANETLPAVLVTYGDRVRYVVRNFPVQPVNQMAFPAAEAVECAYRQGRFWEYRDALFRDVTRLDSGRLLALAGPVGLDSAAFARCVAERATRAVVEHDLLDAWSYGVSGTPTFFVNGRRFRGLRSREQFERYIEFALNQRARAAPTPAAIRRGR